LYSVNTQAKVVRNASGPLIQGTCMCRYVHNA